MTALRSLVAHHDVTWIASAIGEEDRAVAIEAGGAFEETLRDGARCRLRLVVHDPAAYDRYYNVVANPTLWFLQHDLWELLEDRGDDLVRAWEDGYVPVNHAFAVAVLEELAERPDATVFFHDYHLYVAPLVVRHERRDALLAHFTHIPWPPPDRWRVLPEPMRGAIHAGLVANDVVGLPHRALGRRLPRVGDGGAGPGRAVADDGRRAPDLDRPAGVRGARVEPAGAGGRAPARGGAARAGGAARRPHRPVEERRARRPRVRAPPRDVTGGRRARGHARPARPVAADDPRVRRRTSRRSGARSRA